MQNERIFVKHAAASSRNARTEILAKGTTAVVLMEPLYPAAGEVSFVVAGQRYEMPLDDFLDTTADYAMVGPLLPSRSTRATIISAA